MRFPVSLPALAAGACLAVASLTSPALAKSDQATSTTAVEEKPWVADALGSSVDLICPENKGLFGRTTATSLLHRNAFDLMWFPPNLDLSEVWNTLETERASTAGEADAKRHN